MQHEPTFMHHIPATASSTTAVPASPAEVAAAAVGWQRRGLLGRLVRGDASPSRLPTSAERTVDLGAGQSA